MGLCVDGWMDVWMDGWMDRWIDGWIEYTRGIDTREWIHGQMWYRHARMGRCRHLIDCVLINRSQ